MKRRVRVNTAEKDVFLDVESKVKGSEFLQEVAVAAGVHEIGWLGLQYQDITGSWCWLHDQTKVLSQPVDITEEPLVMFLKIRIFPQRPSCLTDTAVQNLVYLQVKAAISSGELISPTSLTTRLDVLARQERVKEYLVETESLNEYGMWHFLMTRPHDTTPVRVSVATTGISVTADNRVHEFPFSEIHDISASGKKFTVRHVSKSLGASVFLGPKNKFVKDLHYLASLHHQFYLINN